MSLKLIGSCLSVCALLSVGCSQTTTSSTAKDYDGSGSSSGASADAQQGATNAQNAELLNNSSQDLYFTDNLNQKTLIPAHKTIYVTKDQMYYTPPSDDGSSQDTVSIYLSVKGNDKISALQSFSAETADQSSWKVSIDVTGAADKQAINMHQAAGGGGGGGSGGGGSGATNRSYSDSAQNRQSQVNSSVYTSGTPAASGNNTAANAPQGQGQSQGYDPSLDPSLAAAGPDFGY